MGAPTLVPPAREWASRAWDCRPRWWETAIFYVAALAFWVFFGASLVAGLVVATLVAILWPFLIAWLEWTDEWVTEPEPAEDE